MITEIPNVSPWLIAGCVFGCIISLFIGIVILSQILEFDSAISLWKGLPLGLIPIGIGISLILFMSVKMDNHKETCDNLLYQATLSRNFDSLTLYIKECE